VGQVVSDRPVILLNCQCDVFSFPRHCGVCQPADSCPPWCTGQPLPSLDVQQAALAWVCHGPPPASSHHQPTVYSQRWCCRVTL